MRKRAQPRLEVSDIKSAAVEESHHLGVDLHWRPRQPPAIDAQENIRRSERDAFVAIHERMVDGRGFRDDVLVLACLWPEQRRLQSPKAAHTGCAAMAPDQGAVESQYIRDGQVIALSHLWLFGEFAVEAVEFLKAGRKRRNHVPARAFFLLAVNVIAQGLIQHGLELSPL